MTLLAVAWATALRMRVWELTHGTAHWWEYGALFSGNTPWLDGRIIYARDLGDGQNARLLALYPERSAYRLVDGQLVPIH